MAKARYNRLGGQVVVGHESPHKFDQFSLDHIGRGEGHQAFTKGLYFWENPNVGRHYHDAFSVHPAVESQKGDWEKANAAYDQYQWQEVQNRHSYNPTAMFVLQEHSPGPDIPGFGREPYYLAFERFFSPEQQAELRRLHGEMKPAAWKDAFDPNEAASRAAKNIPYYRQMYHYLPHEQRTLFSDDRLQSEWADYMAKNYPLNRWDLGDPPPEPGPEPKVGPYSYHVNLNADRSDFPALNAPIADQTDRLRDVLLDIANTEVPTSSRRRDLTHPRDTWTGQRTSTPRPLPMAPVSALARAVPDFEGVLRDRGVPGIRYDDYQSRKTTQPGDGSQNFVVYDPSIIEIVKRYPYSLLAPLLLSQGATQQQAPVASPLAGTLLESY